MANDVPKEKSETPTTNPAGASPDLTVQDLATIRNIIDVASTRGAFKAGELESVGKIYNKLDLFLTNMNDQKGTSQ